MSSPGIAFSCVSDGGHFVGAVALLNSLRLVGHDDPFDLVDCGLEEWQREAIAPHATLVEPPPGRPPMLLKAWAPLLHPARVSVSLDADVIVTRSFGPLAALAEEGKVVAFANDQPERWFAEWAELGFGKPRRQTYVASGHLIVPDRLRSFLELYDEVQAQLDLGKTLLANDGVRVVCRPEDPFYYPDMDVLNALLATALERDNVAAVDYRLAPHAPFPGLRLRDAHSLRCEYDDGVAPFVLHHVLRKPWLAATPSNVYSRLLPRLLFADDVALRLDPRRVPVRLRLSPLAGLDRRRADTQAFLHARLRGKLGIRPRISAWLAS